MRCRRLTILILLFPELSKFNASFMLAKELQQRGHRLVYCGFPAAELHVKNQGFEYVKVDDPQLFKGNRVVTSNNLRQKREQYRLAFKWYATMRQFLRDWIKTNAPDVILLDSFLWRFAPPLLEADASIVTFNTNFSSPFDPRYPPVFSRFIPARKDAFHSRVLMTVLWLPWIYRAYAALLAEKIRLIWCFGLHGSTEYDARRLITLSGGTLTVGEYGARLVAPELMLSPEELDFPALRSKAGRFYAGSCVDEQRIDQGFDWSSIQEDKPLIYCSLGTYSHLYPHSRQLFRAVIDVLKRDFRWQAIIQIGATSDVYDQELPKNAHLVKDVPQLEVLRRATVFVTHGGCSSIRESIYYGVPMIVLPCRSDQPGNAARIVYHNLGVTSDIAAINADELAALLVQSRADEIKKSLEGMTTHFKRQARCTAGAEWIESLGSEDGISPAFDAERRSPNS